ncbi:MAG TPA: HAMP domain-containing histidine kinase [Candidatus Merdenecus merdavium]|nr:HAMP domain-containing histidine kinase [Candidatus Merdenecus merdavium]
MEKVKYSNRSKIIAIILQFFFAVTFIVSFCICIIFLNDGFDIMEGRDFEETSRFKDYLSDQTSNIVDYVTQGNKFEVDGVFDGSKVVDIREYLDTNQISGNVRDSYGVRVEDLLQWSREGYIPDSITIYLNMEGELTPFSVDNIRSDNGFPSEYLEPYGIYDYSSVLSDLEYIVEDYIFMNDYLIYKNADSQYLSTQSNVRFMFTSGRDSIIKSNIEEGGLENLKKHSAYIEINGSDFTVNASSNIDEQLYYHDMTRMSTKIGDQYSLFVGIDTDYPIHDYFYDQKVEYEMWQPWVQVCLILGLVSLVGTVVCLIYLSLAAGRKEDGAPIRLMTIDKIYTEIAALGFSGVIIIAGILLLQTFAYGLSRGGMGILAMAASGIILNMVALSAYLSLVRRMKAGNLWTNSILYKMIKAIQMGMEHSASSVKVIFSYVVFLIINLFLVLLGPGGIFLALIIDSVYGYRLVKESIERKKLLEGAQRMVEGDLNFKIDGNRMSKDNKTMALAMNNVGEGLKKAMEENLKGERLKADLITNVSHDIKTPLTSIINYVSLLKRENIQDEKIRGYIDILDNKSQRLKNLTEDLVEASKVSSGNIVLDFNKMNFNELVLQTLGEFSEKFQARNLEIITNLTPEPVYILADGRRMWRIIENIYNNVAKYAMENTRVYMDEDVVNGYMYFSIKNISQQALNINADQLTERFIRGDVSRSTEGSGLGLSIARDLTQLQGGTFHIYLDGDLFKVTVVFPIMYQNEDENAFEPFRGQGMEQYDDNPGYDEYARNQEQYYEQGRDEMARNDQYHQNMDGYEE